jgi:hypothetical protein
MKLLRFNLTFWLTTLLLQEAEAGVEDILLVVAALADIEHLQTNN